MESDDPVGVAANDESTDESDPSDKSPAIDSSWADVSTSCSFGESGVHAVTAGAPCKQEKN